MARTAEDLFLLLHDNPSAEPDLDGARLRLALAGAVLLDLAYGCHIRPAGPGDGVPDGRLIVLASETPVDAVGRQALHLLRKRPLSPLTAMSTLGPKVPDAVMAALESSGQIRRAVTGPVWHRTDSLSLLTRTRVDEARAALLAALFARQPPTPATVGIVTLLHAVDGLGAVLSLNDRGWRWVHVRAAEIAGGRWVHESATGIGEANLAVTASALRSALDAPR